MARKRGIPPLKVTRTVYVEIGILNAVDNISQGWNVSRNEAIQRILARGVAGIIEDEVKRQREARPVPAFVSSGTIADARPAPPEPSTGSG